MGSNVTAVPGDVANLSDLDRLYDAVKKLNRKIDVFANAGISLLAPLDDVDEKFFDLHFDANVKGLFFTVQKALPLLNDGAAIILNGSIATIKGVPATSVYSATKAAVRSFVRTWTSELRERRIRVNVISPGYTDTPLLESWKQGEALAKLKEEMTNSVPLGKMGVQTISPKRSRSSHPMKRATSPASSSLSMAAWPRFETAAKTEYFGRFTPSTHH